MSQVWQMGDEMKTASELFAKAFEGPRDKRSEEYKLGVLEALRFRLGEISGMRCPYAPGTAQADAYFAGTDEGHRIGRDYLG